MQNNNHTYELTDKEGKVVGNVTIKKTISEYAAGAINELSSQLLTVKSPSRRNRIETRIKQWQAFLKQLAEKQTKPLEPDKISTEAFDQILNASQEINETSSNENK